jgi:hypothetical protein
VHERDVDVEPHRLHFKAGALSPNRHQGDFEPGFNIVTLNVVEGASNQFKLEVVAEVWAWQKDPGRFRLHQNREGHDRWEHSIALKSIPAGATPMNSTDRPPPPMPRETGGAGPSIQLFWRLSGAAKARVATSMGLLTEDERRLPERYRYTNIFSRATERGKLDELIAAIHSEGK